MARLSYATNLILIVVLVGLLGSRSQHASAPSEGGLMQTATSDSQQVSETFSRYMQAYEKKDMETLRKIFANDEKLQAFWPDPSNPFRIEGWKEVQRGLEEYLPAISSMTVNIRQPIVQVYGPLAIVSCHWSFSGAVGGKPQVGSGRGSYVFEKRKGDWEIVHLHESSMPSASR
jgi:ketosteroid isomerase-like protein